MKVERIVNNPISSNCFVLFETGASDCVVVDPGSEDMGNVLDFLHKESLVVRYIMLTHEHFDHIWGIRALKDRFPDSKIVCSEICGRMIIDSKKNCSVYYNQVGFKAQSPNIIIEHEEMTINFSGYRFEFFRTPGHTTSSICFTVGNNIFTGDTLIKDTPTVTKLPTGSVENLRQSHIFLRSLYGRSLIVCPGHGVCFPMDTYRF